jgi:hypothetical protein
MYDLAQPRYDQARQFSANDPVETPADLQPGGA